ncbi:protein-tyrosine phosphatase-like protein [Podospora didyma]|uniref:Protein-tyrosine phosphatase-like protein n=1 Tax=Podospora didyma TaxID=330526 RepID=A0AAE0KL60_9PEZI|nr:protein-tyrosine phosphatase-like protein [Podospora didyma]
MASSVDLEALSETDVSVAIPKESLVAALQTPPFVYVPGTFNTRDIGTITTSSTSPKGGIRLGYVFRSGGFLSSSPLGEDGKAVLTQKLGIKRIFDLRSVGEHAGQPDPEIDGVENSWTPAEELEAVVALADFVEGGGEIGYEKMYLDVLSTYKRSIKGLLEHVRDRPDEPFLFHCTAGRDRTGVVAGLLMALAGADNDAIKLDYMLSRIGTEPAREQLLAFAMKGSGATGIDTPGFKNLCSLRESFWDAFVDAVERDYNGFEKYVTHTLRFGEDELATIKKNLAVGGAP